MSAERLHTRVPGEQVLDIVWAQRIALLKKMGSLDRKTLRVYLSEDAWMSVMAMPCDRSRSYVQFHPDEEKVFGMEVFRVVSNVPTIHVAEFP